MAVTRIPSRAGRVDFGETARETFAMAWLSWEVEQENLMVKTVLSGVEKFWGQGGNRSLLALSLR